MPDDVHRVSAILIHDAEHRDVRADTVAEELIPHVDSLFTAIDASVAGEPDYQSKLSIAAQHMPMTAAVLTSGIVANKKIES